MLSRNYSSCHNGYVFIKLTIVFINIQYANGVLISQERVTYNKEIQTTDFEVDATPSNEEEIRERVLRERDQAEAERAREKELEEESVQLDKEIEQEIRGLFIYLSSLCLTDSRRYHCLPMAQISRRKNERASSLRRNS